MFATKATRYNIVDWTRFGRDPMKELAEECHRQGIKLFFYYSQLDWHNPDYWPRGQTGQYSGRPESGDWNRYLAFMDTQLTELLTNYGPIGGIWFDGMWDKPDADWQLPETYALIHRLQPAALIIPNHHQAPKPGEDVQTFEQDLPGANTAGFNTTTIGGLPLETSMTMNDSWGFNITDHHFKSADELIQKLASAAGRDANLLLNIGPRPDGTIQPEALARLHDIGEWMKVIWRLDLRHARRADSAARVGCDHLPRRHRVRARAALDRPRPGHSGVRTPRGEGKDARRWGARWRRPDRRVDHADPSARRCVGARSRRGANGWGSGSASRASLTREADNGRFHGSTA